jgi:hypothetical protein
MESEMRSAASVPGTKGDNPGSFWGALAEPVTTSLSDSVHERWRDRYPWKDNLWLVFWDPSQKAAGMVWSTTSPNGAPRKTRVVASLAGRTLDLIEEPPVGSLSSPSVELGRAFGEEIKGSQPHHVRVRSEDIDLDLELCPRWRPLDYTAKHVLPPLGEAPELHHYQQGTQVSGSMRVRAEEIPFNGFGFRDRTWGWRSEGRQFRELYGASLCFENFDLTLLKFLLPDDSTLAGGFLQADDGIHDVEGARLVYNEIGLAASLDVEIAGRDALHLEADPVDCGWWMSFYARGTRPPVLVEYEAMQAWRSQDGQEGYGVIGHDVLRLIG